MLGRIKESIIIQAPPERIWDMLIFDRFPEWNETFGERVEYTSEVHTPEDKYRVGATARGIPKKPGDVCCRFEMKESLEHEKIAFRAWEETKYFGTLSMLPTYSLEPVGTATKFTYELESDFWGIFGKFLFKLFAITLEKQVEKS